MTKILIICGPTATGKTKFGLNLARKFEGEIISADSRQVYVGRNIIYGKDLPANLKPQTSNLKWRDRYLKYYEVEGIKIWLYDVVSSNEPFNIAFWKECADLVIVDILERKKLPVVIGGTGLYLKSLSQSLSQISVPTNLLLRNKLANKSPKYLFNYLNKIDSTRAASLNSSDRKNPRRLFRAIEISLYLSPPSTKLGEGGRGGEISDFLLIGLTAPRDILYKLVDQRVADRIAAGAKREDPSLAGDPSGWKSSEHAIVRHQLTWFKKQPGTIWFDVSTPTWDTAAIQLVQNWYNNR